MQVNYTDDVELKALMVERSITIAVESYEASNLFAPVSDETGSSSKISHDKLTKLINYLLGKCYKQEQGGFTLYSDLVYVSMVLQNGYDEFKNVKKVVM